MARNKSKLEAKSIQLELFPQQQLVETGQDKQNNTGQPDQQAEATPPKKRTRTKKSPEQPAQTTDPEVPSPEQVAEPVITTPLPIEETPSPLKSNDPKQTEKKEARQKENFKKIQEERLAALRKAREKK